MSASFNGGTSSGWAAACKAVAFTQGGSHEVALTTTLLRKSLEHILQRCRQHLRREVCGKNNYRYEY